MDSYPYPEDQSDTLWDFINNEIMWGIGLILLGLVILSITAYLYERNHR